MRTRSLVLILAVWAVVVGLSTADNAFMGTWKLNEAKSKIPAGAGKKTTVVPSPAGDEAKERPTAWMAQASQVISSGPASSTASVIGLPACRT